MRFLNHSFDFKAKTYVMGILNLTPDSFSDDGIFMNTRKALGLAKSMESEGADIIDIGGESTRPDAVEVDVVEELARVIPVLELLVQEISIPISIDTYKAVVAEKALAKGAALVNDVWGLQRDPAMSEVISEYKVPVVIMHNQKGTDCVGDIIEAIFRFFECSLKIASKAGIKEDCIILDPGIGFGKTPEQNVEILSRLNEFSRLGFPLLLGVSRKSVLGHILTLPIDQRIEGTLASSVLGVVKGANIIRVHDVKENLRAVRVADALMRN